MRSVVVVFLVIPVIIVVAVHHPEATGHFVAVVIIAGARMLSAVADFLGKLIEGTGR